MGLAPQQAESTLAMLDKVLSSTVFTGAERSSRLLRFLVESAVRGQADRLKEYTLGTEALGRGETFDPRIDSIARVEVSRLRNRLEQYYATEGREDPIEIVLPRGTYVPLFEKRAIAPGVQLQASNTGAQKSILRSFIWFASGAAAVALGFALFLGAPWRAVHDANRSLMQFDVQLTPGTFASTSIGSDIALSPDGSSLVFGEYISGNMHLARRRLEQREVIELPGTDGARGPFFSPDGQWIAFWAAGKLKKISVGGGPPITICNATDLLGGTWGKDGNIVAALDSSRRLWRVSASGGTPTPILDLTRESFVPRWPQVLPGGKAVMFTSIGSLGPDAGNIEVFSLESGARKTLLHGGMYGRYLHNGILTYINQGTLYAVAFDLDRLEVRGSPVAMLQDVSYSSSWGFAQLDFSRDGTLAYRRDPSRGQLTIQWLDNDGTAQPLLSKPGPYQFPQFSPNGRRLAFVVTDSGSSKISIAEGDPKRLTPLTSEDGVHRNPVWSPDGRYMVYGSTQGMSWVAPGSNTKPQLLTESSNKQFPWSFTADGKRLAFFEISPTTGFDLWTVALQTGGEGLRAGKPEPFLVTPNFEIYPTFSPDGRWIAYGSNKSGAWEVYVRAFPGGDSDVKISKDGGRITRWPTNGHEIFYSTDDQRIMTVPYRIEGNLFQAGKPRVWSERRLANTGVLPNFDVTRDGKRVAALMPAINEKQSLNEVTFLLNFSDDVRRRVAESGQDR